MGAWPGPIGVIMYIRWRAVQLRGPAAAAGAAAGVVQWRGGGQKDKDSTAQHSAAQRSTAQHSAAQRSTALVYVRHYDGGRRLGAHIDSGDRHRRLTPYMQGLAHNYRKKRRQGRHSAPATNRTVIGLSRARSHSNKDSPARRRHPPPPGRTADRRAQRSGRTQTRSNDTDTHTQYDSD